MYVMHSQKKLVNVRKLNISKISKCLPTTANESEVGNTNAEVKVFITVLVFVVFFLVINTELVNLLLR